MLTPLDIAPKQRAPGIPFNKNLALAELTASDTLVGCSGVKKIPRL
jgi:hypothetical protein